MYDSNNNMLSDKAKGISRRYRKAFTLVELAATLLIIGAIITSTMTVMDHCIGATIDYNARAIAFRMARDNMENLLNTKSMEEMAEFGIYEFDPDIQWETVVETFRDPINSSMWLQAVCSASYTDKDGERQSVELTNWITELSAGQQRQIKDQDKREKDFMDEHGENPFGDDPDGMLKYANSLAESGDLEAAMQAAYDLMTEYPDSQQTKIAEDKARKWMLESTGFAIPGYNGSSDGFDDRIDDMDMGNDDGYLNEDPYQDRSSVENSPYESAQTEDIKPTQAETSNQQARQGNTASENSRKAEAVRQKARQQAAAKQNTKQAKAARQTDTANQKTRQAKASNQKTRQTKTPDRKPNNNNTKPQKQPEKKARYPDNIPKEFYALYDYLMSLENQ